ncbi:MAG: hypothetical protein QOH46_2577 [Solirubrobacteraceae bacterium]|jgi:hypothetical protein|nr:hypothetical protein [Solirubrobacteraceae bacterium]
MDGPRRPGRARLVAIAAVALVAVAAVATLTGGDGPVRVAVQPGAPGRAVPRSFLGLSMEWTSVEPFGGAARPGVVRLLRRLEAGTRSPLALRVGGASADEAWWNPAGRPRPRTVLHDLGPGTLAAIERLSAALDAPVTVGLNLSLGDPANALALARAAQRRLSPRLEALEIGNEPDLYAVARTIGPVPVRRLRKRARYDPVAYEREAARYLDVLARDLRRPPRFVVGGLAGSPAWVRALPTVVDLLKDRPGALAVHRYALPGCVLDPDAPTLRGRLLSEATRERLLGLRPLVALAHRRGLPLWVAELNSAPCGGAPGVSDTFAAALWLTDALFSLLRMGADRADVHTWDGAVYALFQRAGSEVLERPPFFGVLAFARAAPRGSRLVPVRLEDAGPVRAWATMDAAGTVRIALVNPADGGRRAVRIAVAPGRPCALVRVTTAPSLDARHGIADRTGRLHCPRGRTLSLGLPGPSVAVVELPPAP